MSKLEQLINELCPDGVQYKTLSDCLVRTKGTKITAEQMKHLNKKNAPVKIFAGGKTVAHFDYADLPEKDIQTTPSIIVKSRGLVEFEYYDKPFSHKNEFWAYHSNDENIDIKYVYYFLKNEEPYFKNVATSMGSLPQISIPVTDTFKIPLPPLPVQEEIVRILDNFTELTAEFTAELTAELTAKKQQYEYYRDSLLTFSDEVQWKTLGECTLKTNNIKWSDNKEKQFQYIDLSSVNRVDNRIYETQSINSDNAPNRAQQIVLEDDVLFGSTRPMLKRYCLIPEEYNNQICSTGYCVLRANTDFVLPKWIFYLISTEDFYVNVEKYQKGASYPAITDKEIKAYKIPVMPISEQQRIVEILDCFGKLCNDISVSLHAEIKTRQQQYEYYRDKLLTFKEKEVCENE